MTFALIEAKSPIYAFDYLRIRGGEVINHFVNTRKQQHTQELCSNNLSKTTSLQRLSAPLPSSMFLSVFLRLLISLLSLLLLPQNLPTQKHGHAKIDEFPLSGRGFRFF